MNQETKNYSPLRFSKSFGDGGRCLNIGFNKQDFVKWVESCPADDKGNIKFSICPRKSASDSNAFTMFQDTWKPDSLKVRTEPSLRHVAPESGNNPKRDDDVPFN